MPEFYIIMARKKFFPEILGGHVPLLPPLPSPTPMPMSYGLRRPPDGVDIY